MNNERLSANVHEGDFYTFCSKCDKYWEKLQLWKGDRCDCGGKLNRYVFYKGRFIKL